MTSDADGAGDHARLMDKVYRRQRHFYDFTRRYYLFGRDRMIRSLALADNARLIEIGCGTARNLIKIARRYPRAELFGLDASSEMLKTAARNVARAGLGERIRLAQGYAEALSPALFGETTGFDVALFSYSLSMIPDWRQALASAGASLSAGGTIRVVDFGDLKGLPRAAEQLLRRWLGLFHVEPRGDLLTAFGHIRGKDGDLILLPGRYAFLLTLRKQGVEAIPFPVAH